MCRPVRGFLLVFAFPPLPGVGYVLSPYRVLAAQKVLYQDRVKLHNGIPIDVRNNFIAMLVFE
jgi:hypothetical protein